MSKIINSQDGHEFRVKDEFLKRYPHPEQYFAYDLINGCNLISYLVDFNDRVEELFDDE